jgi:cytochrome c-type biogenesis protein CcmF
VLLGLVGLGPMLAWRRASRASLRRRLVVPAIAGAATGLLAFVAGVRDDTALACLAVAGLVAGAIVQEFARGVRARHLIHGEPHALAALRLLSGGRRRYGGYVVHFGFVVCCAGFAGGAFAAQHDVTLGAAQAFSVRDPWGHDWTFRSLGVSNDEQLNRIVRFVALSPARGGRTLPFIRSETRLHVDANGVAAYAPVTVPGILHTWCEDVYVVFTGVLADGRAGVSISFNPLVTWDWVGGVLMLLGGLIVLWPAQGGARREAGYLAELS